MNGSTYDYREIFKTGWMHITNNINRTSSEYEWTMARCGAFQSAYRIWSIYPFGVINNYDETGSTLVRPTFYLESSVSKKSGTRTFTDPYIIN